MLLNINFDSPTKFKAQPQIELNHTHAHIETISSTLLFRS